MTAWSLAREVLRSVDKVIIVDHGNLLPRKCRQDIVLAL
jgi:hypothetical protein